MFGLLQCVRNFVDLYLLLVALAEIFFFSYSGCDSGVHWSEKTDMM